MSKKNSERNNVSRREFIISTVVGGIALTTQSGVSFANEKTIKIGFISPRTGPLAGFGQSDGFVLDVVRSVLETGISAAGSNHKVEIFDRDTQSDPSRAGQLAKELINNEKVDLMLVVSAPETINPVADACEASGVPCLSTVMPWEAWYFGRGAKPGEPSPFKWTYHFGFGVDEFLDCYLSQWDLVKTNKKVGVMYPNDADGNAIRAVLAPRLEKAGYTLIDPGAYETGTSDYTTQIALFKKEGIEIFNTFPIPPDFAAFWRQAAQQGLTRKIKICQVAKTGLFPSDVEALGSLGNKLSSAAYWHKSFPYSSPVTGYSGEKLCDEYEATTKRQWTQQLGATMALFDAGIEALKSSKDPFDKSSVAAAIASLNVTTIAGKIDFTSGPVPNVAFGPLVGTQWVKSKEGPFEYDYLITENATDTNVPVQAKLLAYNA